MKKPKSINIKIELIILFFLIVAFHGQVSAQSYNYDETWKRIEQQELEGLLKSVLPLVDEIYDQAKKNGHTQQKVKALLYQSKITLITQDDRTQESQLLARFKSEISTAKPVEKSILQSLLAGLLYEYYQNNRYRLSSRTVVEGTLATNDFLTWDNATFQKEIAKLYDASIGQEAVLIDEPVADWTFILDTATQFRELRPTIYDVLIHRAAKYYKGNNQYRKGFQLIQTLIDKHHNNSNKNAYLYNRLANLEKNKPEDEQIEDLIGLTKVYPDAWYTSEILLQLATFYQRRLPKLQTTNDKKQLLDSILAIGHLIGNSYSGTVADKQMRSTITEPILSSALDVQSEKYSIPGQPIPVFISHKNINKLYVKVLSYQSFKNRDFDVQNDVKSPSDIDSLIESHQELQSYSRDLRVFDDYQYHSTLVKFDALDNGEYLVLISNNESFNMDTGNIITFQTFKVSNNALLIRGDELLLTDRQSGKLRKNVEIGIYKPSADLLSFDLTNMVVTDENGIVKIDRDSQLENSKIRNLFYKVKGDNVFFRTTYYNPSIRNNVKTNTERVQFFIDRGIYRPGQTVYFKGIIYSEIGEERRVLVNSKTTVKLYDPNNVEIESHELTSNQYGSVFGSFILPQGKLTGNFYIETSNNLNRKSFRVEEYKRPTFQIVMDTVKENFKIGQEAVVKGSVQAFSGAFVDQARVKYQVIRTSRFPYPIWRGTKSNFDFETIAAGEMITGKGGEFEVRFVAKPAQEEKERFRFYSYQIQVTATDLSGETHVEKQTILIGDKSIVLTIPIPETVNLDYTDSIPLQTVNLNGQPVSATGNIRLTKLKAPERVLRTFTPRTIDYMLEDSLQFIKYFPHLPYGNEHKTDNWPKEKLVFDENFNSTGQHAVSINNTGRWQEGAYLLEAYVLDGQDTLRMSRLLRLHRSKPKKSVDNELLRVAFAKPSYRPGENAEVVFSSAANNVVILVELEQGGKIVKREQLTLNKNAKSLTYPISTNAKDQLFIHYHIGKYNSINNGTLRIPIEQPSTDITITTSTFRDKLRPGQEETWELKFGGVDKEKVFPEVLALMYDASLDKFAQNRLFFPRAMSFNSSIARWNAAYSYGIVFGRTPFFSTRPHNLLTKYEDLLYFGFSFFNPSHKQADYLNRLSGKVGGEDAIFTSAGPMNEVVVVGYGTQKKESVVGTISTVEPSDLRIPSSSLTTDLAGRVGGGPESMIRGNVGSEQVQTSAAEPESFNMIAPRKDLKESAFFYPDLRTDEEGNLRLHFTAPERLSEWKFMIFAHTPDLQTGYLEKTVRTSKDLMVVPNVPRFLRAGDDMILTAKVINLSEVSSAGAAKLMFFDAITLQPLDSLFASGGSKKFDLEKGASSAVSWRIKVPHLHHPVVIRIVATAGNFTDGEESVLAILPDKQLVTESISLNAKEGKKQKFTLENLASSNKSTTEHLRLTLEIADNPMWYAIQALPYLHESSYQSSEQLFAKLYSSLVSKHLVDVTPTLKVVFDEWNSRDQHQSKLEANEELKTLLVEETPWVREAEDEKTRMKRLALMFDLNNMQQQYKSTFARLKETQLRSGAFPWFEGGNASQYITNHILAGFGHLKMLKSNSADSDSSYHQLINKAIHYLDLNARNYLNIQDIKPAALNHNVLYYLYARSYFLEEMPLDNTLVSAIFQLLHERKSDLTLQSKAMLALVYKRFGEHNKANALVKSLKDYAVQSEESGMYWKDNVSGWNWWQSPIETQAILIEAFQEIANDQASVAQMKIWLLKNKQTNHWAATKATTEAIYSLLVSGENWLAAEADTKVKIGDKFIEADSETSGAGYDKYTWDKSEIKPEMAHVEISKTSPGVVWGSLHWQYFQSLDKIKASSNGLELDKALFFKRSTEKGVVLNPITNNTPIQVGDVITVRLVIRADRDLQFMHLKDMRASGFEPVNVVSAYKRQDGLGYYQSTRDAVTNFFIDRIPKGTYVLEYDLRANNAGSFSNGITTLQSMYAPEMGANSEGMQIKIAPMEP